MSRVVTYYDVPVYASIGTCRESDCARRIYWIKTGKGHNMPVDCAADENCREPVGREDGVGVSHFTNCKGANRFSRSSKGEKD